MQEFTARLQEKVHQAQMEANRIESQAKLAQERALSAVRMARQQTATKLAETKAAAEKELAMQRTRLLEELDALAAAAQAEVKSAQAEAAESQNAAKAAQNKARQEGAKEKAEAMRLANLQIEAIRKSARDSMSQATKLAVGAKNEAIESAEHEATGARQDAEKARAELARVAQRITEEKNRQKMAANDAEAEMKRRAAQLTSAANTEHGLIAKNRMLHSVLRDTEIELKSTEEDNDKLRGFMLVYKSMAENLNSDAHAAEWQLATLEKKQRGNGKVMKVARKLADAARDENYQMKSMYESLERSRRKAVEQA